MTDRDVIGEASQLSGIAENKIERVFSDKISVFNRLTRERERSLAYLRMALARCLEGDELIISGFAGQMIPRNIDHVVRVCLIADMNARVRTAVDMLSVSDSEALKRIHIEDEKCASK